jgi:hypothetical protein
METSHATSLPRCVPVSYCGFAVAITVAVLWLWLVLCADVALLQPPLAAPANTRRHFIRAPCCACCAGPGHPSHDLGRQVQSEPPGGRPPQGALHFCLLQGESGAGNRSRRALVCSRPCAMPATLQPVSHPAACSAAALKCPFSANAAPCVRVHICSVQGRTQQNNPPYSRGIRQTLENLCRECACQPPPTTGLTAAATAAPPALYCRQGRVYGLFLALHRPFPLPSCLSLLPVQTPAACRGQRLVEQVQDPSGGGLPRGGHWLLY